MKDHLTYIPNGVCSRQIDIDIEDGKIVKASIIGGCSGNTQGICSLLRGMSVDDAINRLDGIRCGFKETSCPDQIAHALKGYKNNK